MDKTVTRKQIGVQMDVDLWWQFKERAIQERLSAGLLLEKIVRAYLEAPKAHQKEASNP